MVDYACFYLLSESFAASDIKDVPGLMKVIDAQDEVLNYVIYLQFAKFSLKLTPMMKSRVASQLRGLSNFVLSKHFEKHNPKTEELLEKIAEVRHVVGCVISPGYDNEGCVGDALISMAGKLGALLFARDCLFNQVGDIVIDGVVPN